MNHFTTQSQLFFLILWGCFFSQSELLAQNETIGSWRSFLSLNAAKDVQNDNNQIIAITTGGLAVFNSSYELEKRIGPIEGLHKALNPTTLLKIEASSEVIIGYQDGMIDILNLENTSVRPVNDLFRSTRFTNKEIQKIIQDPGQNDRVWILTSFGIIDFRFQDAFISNTYSRFEQQNSASPLIGATIFNEHLFILREDAVFFAPLSEDSRLSLPNVWQSWKPDGTDETLSFLDSAGGSLFIASNQSFYRWNMDNNQPIQVSAWFKPGIFDVSFTDESLQIISQASETSDYTISNGTLEAPVQELRIPAELQINGITRANEQLVLASSTQGLLLINQAFDAYEVVPIEGPSSNFFDGLSLDLERGFLISGTTGQPQADLPGTESRGIHLLDLIDEQWLSINKLNEAALREVNFQSAFRSIIYQGQYFFGSWGRGILKYDPESTTFQKYELEDGVVGVGGGNYSVTHDFSVDPQGRLWATSFASSRPLQFYDSEQDRWLALDYIAPSSSADNYRDLLIDRNGNKWISMRSISGTGLLIVDTADPADPTDDRGIRLTTDPNNGNLPDQTVRAIIEDLDGEIWIGTSSGIARFLFPDFILDGGRAERTAQWLLNADTAADRPFLLPEINVNVIEVDGANRKWVGTPSDGLWLLNAEGNRIIQHFNTSNSPLISDAIIDLAFEPTEGDLFIATDKGLMAYRTESLADISDAKNLRIYPNPLNSIQHGEVIIEGFEGEALYQIFTVDGLLVDRFQARGGRATWNARRRDGGALASGVYIITATSIEGNKSISGKLVVIR